MAPQYTKPGWLVTLALTLILSACGIGYQTVLPPIDLKPLSSTGFYNHCTDVEDVKCHLFYIGTKPITIRTWTEPALPFGTNRYLIALGDYGFWSRVWFPLGVPTYKGEHCGLQTYGGIKVEGTIHRELNNLYKRPGIPLEFKPSEQHALRWKCDLDIIPDVDNLAGF